jgi:hypothetical protein
VKKDAAFYEPGEIATMNLCLRRPDNLSGYFLIFIEQSDAG